MVFERHLTVEYFKDMDQHVQILNLTWCERVTAGDSMHVRPWNYNSSMVRHNFNV